MLRVAGSSPEAKVSDSQARQKRAHDNGTKEYEFNVGDAVWVKGQRNQQSWLPSDHTKAQHLVLHGKSSRPIAVSTCGSLKKKGNDQVC